MERAILDAVSREQDRIGNDLHDGLGQELTGIALMLRCLAGRLQSEHGAAPPEIEGITQLLNNAVENTRSLARGLSPVHLERGGLRDALEGLAMHARSVYGIKAEFVDKLPPTIQLETEMANHLYRIAQEAVTNAVKHGHAESVRLHLTETHGRLRLTIGDDGCGLPSELLTSAAQDRLRSEANADGLGLRIMRYRARIARGDVRFENCAPRGARVICECPIDLGGQVPAKTAAQQNAKAGAARPKKRAAANASAHTRAVTGKKQKLRAK